MQPKCKQSYGVTCVAYFNFLKWWCIFRVYDIHHPWLAIWIDMCAAKMHLELGPIVSQAQINTFVFNVGWCILFVLLLTMET